MFKIEHLKMSLGVKFRNGSQNMEHTYEGLTLCMGNQHALFYHRTHICYYQPCSGLPDGIISIPFRPVLE